MSRNHRSQTRTLISRRAALRSATAGGGAAVLALAACGRGEDKQTTRTAATTAPAPSAALDATKGKPGGRFVVQANSHPGTLVLVRTNNIGTAQRAGFTHSGLLEFSNGTPGVDGYDISVRPDLAQAMPEAPDGLTYVFKLKPAKFHSGRDVTSEDVKYSFERYAFGPDSAYQSSWGVWLDKVETPDPRTAVVKTKIPYAEALQSMAVRTDAFILAREHEEGPEVERRLMGSGAFLFVDTQPPVATRFRRNPEYFNQPFPYFDEIEILGTSDFSKRIADFIARQTHMTYWHNEEQRDQIKASRRDALLFAYENSANAIFMRTDQAPFTDKRVRQALSMTIDRKAIRDATSKGEGEDDQALSIAGKYWGFRKPSELGAAARYWKYDPQAAKQLLSAAGITQPIEANMTHWDATVIGQSLVDQATLIQSGWRNLGVANPRDIVITLAQQGTTVVIGNYDGMYLFPNQLATLPAFGIALRAQLWSPPEGVKVPTLNTGHINDPQLSALADKQLTQLDREERRKTLAQIEEIMAEQMYRIPLSTYSLNFFADPSLKNIQIPRDAYQGSIGYVKYWWFDKT